MSNFMHDSKKEVKRSIFIVNLYNNKNILKAMYIGHTTLNNLEDYFKKYKRKFISYYTQNFGYHCTKPILYKTFHFANFADIKKEEDKLVAYYSKKIGNEVCICGGALACEGKFIKNNSVFKIPKYADTDYKKVINDAFIKTIENKVNYKNPQLWWSRGNNLLYDIKEELIKTGNNEGASLIKLHEIIEKVRKENICTINTPWLWSRKGASTYDILR